MGDLNHYNISLYTLSKFDHEIRKIKNARFQINNKI